MPFATPVLKKLPLLPDPQPKPGEATYPGPGEGVHLSLEPTGLCVGQAAWGTHIWGAPMPARFRGAKGAANDMLFQSLAP